MGKSVCFTESDKT